MAANLAPTHPSTTASDTDEGSAPALPLVAAGTFLTCVAGRDFAGLARTLTRDARFRALLPGGYLELTGADAIADQFASWFGHADPLDLADGAVGEVGGRVHLHMRLRLRSPRLGAGWFVVEQQVYAGADERGRIARMDLLCTGYRREERPDAGDDDGS